MTDEDLRDFVKRLDDRVSQLEADRTKVQKAILQSTTFALKIATMSSVSDRDTYDRMLEEATALLTDIHDLLGMETGDE